MPLDAPARQCRAAEGKSCSTVGSQGQRPRHDILLHHRMIMQVLQPALRLQCYAPPFLRAFSLPSALFPRKGDTC